jgi:hypothetical protein
MESDQELECIICFDDIKMSNAFTCGEPTCEKYICGDCLKMIIKHSNDDNKIPSCSVMECKSYYLQSDVRRLGKDTTTLYNNCCLKFMLKDQGEGVQKKMEQQKMIEKIRGERMKFIQANFPAGVALVAQYSFSNKLKRIEKERKGIVEEKLKRAHRKCMNIICKGYLNPNFVCMTCMTEFCKLCEVKLKSNHVCRKDDLESMKVIKQSKKCPGCFLPVFKNQGCDSITCSNCGTNFLYSNGKKGGHGSGNAKIDVDTGTPDSLSMVYRDMLDDELFSILIQIEIMKPSLVNNNYMMLPLKHYYEDKDEKKAGKGIARGFDRYTRNLYENRDYNRKMIQVEELLKSGKVTEEKLREFLPNIDDTDSSDNDILIIDNKKHKEPPKEPHKKRKPRKKSKKKIITMVRN